MSSGNLIIQEHDEDEVLSASGMFFIAFPHGGAYGWNFKSINQSYSG